MSQMIRLKANNKKGFFELEVGGVADLSYISSTTRRGRVQENGRVSPCIAAEVMEVYKFESMYRIRKLTPRECGRLMNFPEQAITDMLSVNSATQVYKECGNSIVVNCLVAIFGAMLPGKEDAYKEVTEKPLEWGGEYVEYKGWFIKKDGERANKDDSSDGERSLSDI